MAIDFTAAELAQSQRDMTHNSSFSSAQRLEEAAARRQAAAEMPGQAAAGITAGVVGAPVDIVNAITKAVGLGSDKPVLGSEWIGEKLNANTGSVAFNIGTAIPVGPEGLAKGAVGIAGMVGMAKNVGRMEDVLKGADSAGDAIRGAVGAPRMAAKFDRASARALSQAERLSLAKEFRLQRMAAHASKADPMR